MNGATHEALLDVSALHVAIAGKTVCRDLSMRVAPGEVWAVLGENGVGKSTLLATLAGARGAAGGAVRLCGEAIGRQRPRQRARRLAWLAQQDDDPFPATVLEKVLVGRHPWLERMDWEGPEDVAIARAALAAVDLDGFEARDIGTLSGGERRRVALAAALAQRTPLLLLDEPLAQIDLRHQLASLRHLADLARRGGAVVLITHDPNQAMRFASHALLLFGAGRTLAGPVRAVLNAATLGELYRCPVDAVVHGAETLFVPSVA